MTRFWIDDDEDERTDEERNLVSAFSEALSLARSNAGSSDRLISKCNQWCNGTQLRIKILDYGFQQFSANVSPSTFQRLFVTAFVVVCFLEFMRSMNVDYFFTCVLFCFLLALISLLTAILGFITTTGKTTQSVLKFRSTLILLSKEISLRLIRTRRKFRMISRNDLLLAIPKNTSSPALPRWNYFFQVSLKNFKAWFQISLLALFLLVDFIIMFLFFVELGDYLRSFALTIIIGNAVIQYLNFRKARDEVKHYIDCLDSETEKFTMWFEKKSIFETILRKYEFLKVPILNIFKCGNDIDKIKSSHSFILFTFAVIKVSNSLQDVTDSKNLQKILECLFFDCSHTFSKSTEEFISNKNSDNSGETSKESHDSEKETPSDKQFKTNPSKKYETLKEDDVEFKYNFITNFLFILFSALNNNFTLGSSELLNEDSKKDDHIDTPSFKKYAIKEEDDQDEKYDFIIDFLFNLFYASTNIFSLDSPDLPVDDSDEDKSSNQPIEISPSDETTNTTETDPETKYKYVMDFLFVFLSALTNISLGSEELLENDFDTDKPSNNRLSGESLDKSSTEKEKIQENKYNFIIDFLFNIFWALANNFSVDSQDLSVDDFEGEKPVNIRIGKSIPEKYVINKAKYEYIIDFLLIFFFKLTNISLSSVEPLQNYSKTGKPPNSNFGGGLFSKYSTEKKADEEAKFSFIIDCLFSSFYALINIFSLESADLLVNDPEGEKSSNNHSRSLSEKYATSNKADIKTKQKLTIDFLCMFILELNKIFSIGLMELLEDGSKTKVSSTKRSSFKMSKIVNEADYEAKYDFVIDFFYDLFFAMTNIHSLGSKELLKNESEKEKASNSKLKRNLFQKYDASNKADSKHKYDFIIDLLFQLCSALIKALTSRSVDFLRDSAKNKTSDKISERNRSQIKQTDQETICQRLPVKNLDKIYAEQKSKLKEKTFTTKAKVAISNPSELSIKEPAKEKIPVNRVRKSVKQKNAIVKEVDNETKHKLIIDLLFKAFSILTRIFSLISKELSIKESIKEKSLNKSLQSEKLAVVNKTVFRERPGKVVNKTVCKERRAKVVNKTVCQERPAKVVNETYVKQDVKLKKEVSIRSSAFASESLKLPMNAKPLDSVFERNLSMTPVKAVHHKTDVQEVSPVEGLFKRHVEQNRERRELSSVSLFEPQKLLMHAPINKIPLYNSLERNTLKSYVPRSAVHDRTYSTILPAESSFERIVEQNRKDITPISRSNVYVPEPPKMSLNDPFKVKPMYSSFERIPSVSYATENATDDLIDSLVFPEVPDTLIPEPLGFETRKKEAKKISKKG